MNAVVRREKSLPLPGIEPRSPTRSSVTILNDHIEITELLIYCGSHIYSQRPEKSYGK